MTTAWTHAHAEMIALGRPSRMAEILVGQELRPIWARSSSNFTAAVKLGVV
jgi:hypothetical protein